MGGHNQPTVFKKRVARCQAALCGPPLLLFFLLFRTVLLFFCAVFNSVVVVILSASGRVSRKGDVKNALGQNDRNVTAHCSRDEMVPKAEERTRDGVAKADERTRTE